MGRWGSAGWVTRVNTFVWGGAPLNTTGNLVLRNATKICGYERRWERKREKEKGAPCSGKLWWPRETNTRDLCWTFAHRVSVARWLLGEGTRQKDSANWKRNYNADTHFLHCDVVTRSVSSNAKLVKSDVTLYFARVEYSINEAHYYGLIFYNIM